MSWWKPRFYVYWLVDPRDGNPFYVGKGQRKRLEDHEKEARAGKRSRKCDRIRAILDSGLEVTREKIAVFHDEAAAYAAEVAVIERIGLINLTNVLPGGGTAWEDQVRAEEEIEEGPYTAEILKATGAGMRRALEEYAKHRKFHVLGVDMTEWLLDFARKLIRDCGPEAASKEWGLGKLLVRS